MLAHIKSSIVLYNKLVVARRSACNGGLWLKTTLLLALIAFASAGWAGVALPKRVFDIEAQDLSQALIRFSEQSGLVFVIPVDLIKGKKSAAAKGHLTPVEALARLLAGSGLAGEINAEGLLHIALAEPARDNANDGERAMKQKTDGEPRKKSFFSAVASVVSTLAVGLTATGGAAIAQETGFVLEEIVVTAQKREQNLQDVGISVTAFSGEQLEQLGVTNTTEITLQSPGLQLFTYSPAFIIFNIRGVSQNNFIDTLEAPVAVYVDEAYVASLNGLGQQLFDMERVEVLRGPQGTLFGRNATGGVIHYLTNAPDEEELNGYIKGGIGEYNNYIAEGAVGGALAPNFRARVAGRYEKADGYTKSITEGVRASHGKDGFAVRASMQFDVSDAVQVDAKVYYSEDNDAPTGGYVAYATKASRETGYGTTPESTSTPIAGSVRKHASDLQGSLDREVASVTGRITWDVNDSLQFVSITSYMDIHKDYFEAAGAGFIPNFPFNPVADTSQFTQELRLSGSQDRFRWQVGGYYLDLEIIGNDYVGGEFVTGLPDGRIEANWNLDSKNWSVFGQAEFDLSEQLTFTGGLRYSQDDKSYTLINTIGGEGLIAGGTRLPPDIELFNSAIFPSDLTEIDYGDFAVRAQLDWRPNDDLLVFAAFNRGIKGGNFTTFFSTPQDLAHDEEVLHSYEIGFKKTFPGMGMRLNATGFYYDYDDYQAFGLIAAFPEIRNTNAEVYGGEVELAWSPMARLDLLAGVSFLESEIDRVPTVQNFFGIVLPSQHIEGNELPNAPAVSINFLARYALPMASVGGEFALQIDGNYNSDQYLNLFNSAASEEQAYFVGNLRFSYTTADEKWTATAFVKNFTDTAHRLYLQDLAAGDLFAPVDAPVGGGYIASVYAPPRWAGASVSYRF